jgi:hypothetical protein
VESEGTIVAWCESCVALAYNIQPWYNQKALSWSKKVFAYNIQLEKIRLRMCGAVVTL